MSGPTSVRPRDAWIFSRLMLGANLNGELDDLPDSLRPAGRTLSRREPTERYSAWPIIQGALGPLGDALSQAVAKFGPDDPMPEPEPEVEETRRPATVADLRVLMSETSWVWEGWIPSSTLFGVAGFEGTGKTRFALDLAARIYHGRSWPDGQGPALPLETRTLWVCSDGQHDELAATAASFGLPDEAVAFCAVSSDPYGGNTIDDPETLRLMDEFMGAERFGMVFIDSLTNATARDICSARDTTLLGSPLRDLARRHKTPIGLLLHLAKDGGILGRRIRGLARVVMQLDSPDPARLDRLKLWVPKSFAKKPPALGVTIGERGNTYDSEPPSQPIPSKPGRPPEAKEKALAFVLEKLSLRNDRIGNELVAEFVREGGGEKTFWRAVDDMAKAGRLVKDGGKGTGKQTVLHLALSGPDSPL